MVAIPQVETVEAEAGDHLHVAGKFDLILHIGSRQIGDQVIVGVGGALAKAMVTVKVPPVMVGGSQIWLLPAKRSCPVPRPA